jgi:hypothetical protein
MLGVRRGLSRCATVDKETAAKQARNYSPDVPTVLTLTYVPRGTVTVVYLLHNTQHSVGPTAEFAVDYIRSVISIDGVEYVVPFEMRSV